MELGALARAFGLSALITVLVVAGALIGPSALTMGSTGAPATGVRLEVGWGYILMAPLTTLQDTLSVLALDQHYAVLGTLILVYVLWRVVRYRTSMSRLRRAGVELAVAVVALLGLVAFYAYGAMGPRPMAALVPQDDDVLVLDVHSHTDHSHDARRGFDTADRLEWHDAAGFDAVYLSDHRTWDGYREGVGSNPERAGDGIVLLPGLEVKFAGKYSIAMGDPERYRRAMDGNDLIMDTLALLTAEAGVPPTIVLTIPGPVDGILGATPDSMGFVAMELTDAAPRGLKQSRRERALLLRMADSLDLAVVAATNNHGWGRTAAAWTLMRIPGWRDLTPDELGDAIEAKLHQERRNAAWVVERRVPWSHGDPVALAMTGPAVTWSMFGAMGPAERVSWLLWTWALALAVALGLTPARWVARTHGSRQRSG